MRHATTIALLFLTLLSAAPVQGQHAQLNVLNPQRTWQTDTGTVEEAVLTIRPKGLYMEYGLYLTFSARGSIFSGSDSLEVELYFELPEEAVVTDSWLWVEGDIIRAEILDMWTASEIYENIVQRRRDPSILYKRAQGRYELRIFPMAANETRRVKLTYLAPADWSANHVGAALPAHLLQASRYVPALTLLTWPEGPWRTPRVPEWPDATFKARQDAQLGAHLQATLPPQAFQQALTFTLDAPLDGGLFLSKTPGKNREGFYQLALLPGQALDAAATRRVALLLDYDAAKTELRADELLAAARALLHSSLGPDDYFNLILSRLNVHRASDAWIPADSALIEAVFKDLGSNPLAGYSSLPTLLADGVKFVEERGAGGSLLLLSSSDQIGEAEVANALIDDLKASTGKLPPVFVADLANRNVSNYRIGGRWFTGNEYLYTNLARLTGGTYRTLRDGAPLAQVLGTLFTALDGVVGSFDLYTTLTDGFSYARFTSIDDAPTVLLNEPILQVGKYFGSFPFIVEASGVYDGTPFSQRFVVPEEEIAETDSTLEVLWSGRQILALEHATQTNDIISQIIDLSLDQRVLSLYTAFLALDPSQGGEVCNECEDESDLPVDTEDETPVGDEDVLEAYPNPFRDQVTVAVRLATPVEASRLSAHIFDSMGRRVKTLPLPGAGLVHQFNLTWDGTNDAGQQVASGTYFFVLTTPTTRHTLTLTLVR